MDAARLLLNVYGTWHLSRREGISPFLPLSPEKGALSYFLRTYFHKRDSLSPKDKHRISAAR